MTCGQCRENLSAYADGALGPAEKTSADAHLAECAQCRAELRFIQSAKAAIAGVPAPRLPADLKQTLLAEARRRTRQESPRPSFWSVPAFRYPAAALAATFAALIAILAVSREDRRPSISLDAMLAAHEEYALSRPLAPADIIYSRLPEQVETSGGSPHDL
ncbi:MAG TPA: zf-HC2 domain-containing protein [Elusimicrobiota bacterium]|nr:zf-HC2 domain-containing protein [Elusimicrobiota bacterium]